MLLVIRGLNLRLDLTVICEYIYIYILYIYNILHVEDPISDYF